MYKLKIMCSYCKKDMGVKSTDKKANHNNISHGICDSCLEVEMAKLK